MPELKIPVAPLMKTTSLVLVEGGAERCDGRGVEEAERRFMEALRKGEKMRWLKQRCGRDLSRARDCGIEEC